MLRFLFSMGREHFEGTYILTSFRTTHLCVEYGIIQKSGSWFSYGESRLAQGRDATKALLADNQELCEEIEAKIMQAIADK